MTRKVKLLLGVNEENEDQGDECLSNDTLASDCPWMLWDKNFEVGNHNAAGPSEAALGRPYDWGVGGGGVIWKLMWQINTRKA